MVRIRRLKPGLVFRMVLGSKADCSSRASGNPEWTSGGFEGSEISAIAESDGSSGVQWGTQFIEALLLEINYFRSIFTLNFNFGFISIFLSIIYLTRNLHSSPFKK